MYKMEVKSNDSMLSRKRRYPAILAIKKQHKEYTSCLPCDELAQIERHYCETQQLGDTTQENPTLLLFVPFPSALLVE